MKRKFDTIIHLSGGQDSTFVLWNHLTTHPQSMVCVHHVRLRHSAEDRLEEERKACLAILDWLRRNGLRNFLYYESSFDYGNLPNIDIKDIQIVALFTGIILRTKSFQFCEKPALLLPWHAGEVDDDSFRRGFRVKAMLQALDVPEVEFRFPIADMSLRDMADRMPTDLLKLVHFCRKPRWSRPCGVCNTCREYLEAGIFELFN